MCFFLILYIYIIYSETKTLSGYSLYKLNVPLKIVLREIKKTASFNDKTGVNK